MSGGVDSCVSAYLLKQQGYDVIGLFMRSGATEQVSCATTPADSGSPGVVASKSHKQGCCGVSDAADARRVADMLDIPFHALNFEAAFGRIKDYFADEYLAGRTPNPCVMCNNWLKFGKLWDFAQQVGARRIASGHYARVRAARPEASEGRGLRRPRPSLRSGRATLLRGLDSAKDQSYVLFGIDRRLLGKILFPVGGQPKTEIRSLARAAGMRVADKADSQEICFIPDNDYVGFISRYRGRCETAGELVDTAGNVVGRHDGYQNFTIGQRRGLGVTFGSPRFVVRIEPETKRVVIGEKADLACGQLDADRLNWLVDDVPARFTCRAKIRYRHAPADAEVHVLDADRMRVRFVEPQEGVAPGQAVVLYDGERVLGGGWIR